MLDSDDLGGHIIKAFISSRRGTVTSHLGTKSIGTFIAGSALALLGPGVASAEEYPVDNSGAGDQVGPDMQAQYRAKIAGHKRWWKVTAATETAAMRSAAAESLAAAGPTISSKNLAVEHFPQIHSFYCGPASGKMILKDRRAGNSAVNNDPQDQDHIGNRFHMNTWQRKVTSWSSGLFRKGLNRWEKGSDIGFFVDTPDPTVEQFKTALKWDIQNVSAPFGADTVELANSPNHYNNHPQSQTIGHWIVAEDFSAYGGTTQFADPSTSVWSGVRPKFSATTSTFVNTYLNSNGITW